VRLNPSDQFVDQFSCKKYFEIEVLGGGRGGGDGEYFEQIYPSQFTISNPGLMCFT